MRKLSVKTRIGQREAEESSTKRRELLEIQGQRNGIACVVSALHRLSVEGRDNMRPLLAFVGQGGMWMAQAFRKQRREWRAGNQKQPVQWCYLICYGSSWRIWVETNKSLFQKVNPKKSIRIRMVKQYGHHPEKLNLHSLEIRLCVNSQLTRILKIHSTYPQTLWIKGNLL